MSQQPVRTLLGVTMLAILLAFMAVPASADSVIYNQPTDFNGTYASQNDAGGFGNYATAYDNFTGAGFAITSIQWVGAYFPFPGSVTGFTVSIYADAAGAPGSLVYSTGDVAGNAGETALGLDNAGNSVFSYSQNVNFVAAAGTQYWLSIVGDMGFPPQWGWETGIGGDGASYQCFFGSCGATSNDLAFSVTAVPEPSSLLLLAGGLPAFALRLRTRKK